MRITAAPPSARSEHGFILPQMVIVLMAMAAVAMTTHLATRAPSERTVSVTTSSRLDAAHRALIGHAMAHRRLPCPARGDAVATDADFGRAAPETASTGCTAPTGVLPWRTLGLDETLSLDGWGRRISYRVFAGSRGLTQNRGIDMSDCDLNEPAPAPVDTAGLCPPARTTTAEAFLADKGFAVTGAAVAKAFQPASGSGAAFVLVSHGPTGHGAFLADGTQEPAPTSQAERANTGTSGPFRVEPYKSGDPADPNHFDDELLASTIAEIASAAGLPARDWPDADEDSSRDAEPDMDETDEGRNKEDDDGKGKGKGWAWGQDKEGSEEWQDDKGRDAADRDDKGRGRN